MRIAEMEGPGVGKLLIDTLLGWGYKELTNVQQLAISAGVAEGRSLVVSAPTSSGKTLIGEIAILQAVRHGLTALYLVSHRALADQKFADFSLKFGEASTEAATSVALSTGDREEGEIGSQIVVATYEKALGLFLSGQARFGRTLIVADEAQIIGDATRGAEIEAFLALCRKNSVERFLALTASIGNPQDIAGWMRCELVVSNVRDVPLRQEIWHSGRVTAVTLGDTDLKTTSFAELSADDTAQVVLKLLEMKRGPVLVFTESKREALEGARSFRQSRPRVDKGISLAEQLELFSEPTDASVNLREGAERRVTFHTADLSPQERQVIEGGFMNASFDVCFATSTLAAGVNFPFRSVVFPRLTFRWGDREGSRLGRSEYRNMSGRAGRLGMHPEGFAILLPRNAAEFQHCRDLVMPTNEVLTSRFFGIGLRKTVLGLVSAGLASSEAEILALFENTLYWYQELRHSTEKYAALRARCKEAIEWLSSSKLITEAEGTLESTPLGGACAHSGLLPTTVVALAKMLQEIAQVLENSFDEWADGIIYGVCGCDEFQGEPCTRYLPFPTGVSTQSFDFWHGKNLPVTFNPEDSRLAQASHAISLYAAGMAERKITHMTGISAGLVHRLSLDVAWVLDGLHRISCVAGTGCSQRTSNRIASLARSVRWGAPLEALDLIRVALRAGVPGFGRQRAMALIGQGISNLHELLSTDRDKVSEIVRSEKRANALLEAAANATGVDSARLPTGQLRLARKLGIDEVVKRCNAAGGVEYERAIADLLRIETSWEVIAVDDGVRQNVPDLLLRLGKVAVVIECKTSERSPALIGKEAAWAVMQKATDFDLTIRRVTLGKPIFDETCKKKAVAAQDITLVEHAVFVEGALRVHAGSVDAEAFLKWLSAPGFAELERIGGRASYLA